MAENDYSTFYPDKRGGWRWKIQAGNNEIVDASSEAFVSEAGARENYERAGHDLADAPEKSDERD
jgi:uncharacterized protein YegP (UPF0339 family)